jgi:tRNA threonylcarbamoyladenosine biosynthesis protein TsaB
MLLAIDTATAEVGVSLWSDDGPVASSRAVEGRRHGETLAPAVRAVVVGSGHEMADLTAVAVDTGPGLFTGLRVGVATAKALAAALDLPAVGLSSLEVLAHPHRRQPAVVAAVVDARRREVFRCLYRPEGGVLVEIAAPAVCTPAALAEELAALEVPVLAVGDGARRYADVLAGPGAGRAEGMELAPVDPARRRLPPDGHAPLGRTRSSQRPGGRAPEMGGPGQAPAGAPRIEVAGPIDAYPDAVVLAELAAIRLRAGLHTDAAGLRACYLRQADVRIGWDERAVPAAGTRSPAAGTAESTGRGVGG